MSRTGGSDSLAAGTAGELFDKSIALVRAADLTDASHQLRVQVRFHIFRFVIVIVL